MTRVLKFEEFINEGLWSKGINRSQSGRIRKEDESYYINKFNNYQSFFDISKYNQKFFSYVKDMYIKPITDYMLVHGLKDVKEKIKLPDLDFSFTIDNHEIKIHHNGKNKSTTVICIVKNSSIDITETTYGDFVKHCFVEVFNYPIHEHQEIVSKEIKKDWKTFKERLYYSIHTFLYDNMSKNKEIPKLCDVEFPHIISQELKKDYYFGGCQFYKNYVVYKDRVTSQVYLSNSTFMKDKKLSKDITDVYEEVYNDVVYDLKHVSEGLWSSGIKRSKTGEKRGEDKFSKGDTHFFDEHNGYYFTKKYNITLSEYADVIKDTYNDFVLNYAKAHGTLDMGFTLDDSTKMPDFDFSFHIEDLKNVFVHITYTDDYKEFKVMCGNDSDEFDITDLEFGKYLYGIFTNQAFDILEDHKDILYKNIEMNFDKFEEVLHDYVCDCCYQELKYDVNYGLSLSKLAGIEIDTLHQNKNMVLKKFHFDGVEVNSDGRYIVNLCGEEIQDTHIGKRILEIYKEAYEDALEKIEKKYPYAKK